MSFEQWVAACLVPVALWILLSGLDDLLVDAVYFLRRRPPFPWPAEAALASCPQKRLAILVPLWHEHAVIGQMLRHNLSVIRYHNYDIFAGAYPNDAPTLEAVKAAARDSARVHVATCPHPGPTSKGDCLNWAYQRMTEYEAETGAPFEIVLVHDAEDLIHPDSLLLVNWFARDYHMVQMPVLPLASGLAEWTHGLYCDEFAEFQLKDIPVRQRMGGFVPSNGVGTGYRRTALEWLRRYYGCIFDAECLTEDYETGFRIFAAGFRQLFVPIRFQAGGPVATREYFPRRVPAAIRQRSRWVTGIALQGWQRHGWRVPRGQWYWLWRDRKGLAGNLISLAANGLMLASAATYAYSVSVGEPWLFAAAAPPWVPAMCTASLGLAVVQTLLRAYFSMQIYGAAFASLAPLRIFWANAVNCAATVAALGQFAGARLKRRSLAWRKTDHRYPSGEYLLHLQETAAKNI